MLRRQSDVVLSRQRLLQSQSQAGTGSVRVISASQVMEQTAELAYFCVLPDTAFGDAIDIKEALQSARRSLQEISA